MSQVLAARTWLDPKDRILLVEVDRGTPGSEWEVRRFVPGLTSSEGLSGLVGAAFGFG